MDPDLPSLFEARGILSDLQGDNPRGPGAVRLEGLDGAVATITLDSPSARNAMTVGMMTDLADAAIALSDWRGALLVVRGAPGAFCAGGHLGEVRASLLAPGAGLAMARAMTAILDAVLALPVISIALVDGPALGGGAELLTACDRRLVTPAATVGFVHARLGVAPGWGGAARLVRHVGRPTALRWLTQAPLLRPPDLEAAGFAEPIATAEDLPAILAPLTALPAPALRAIKAQISAAGSDRPAEIAAFGSVWGGPDHRAALDRGRP